LRPLVAPEVEVNVIPDPFGFDLAKLRGSPLRNYRAGAKLGSQKATNGTVRIVPQCNNRALAPEKLRVPLPGATP